MPIRTILDPPSQEPPEPPVVLALEGLARQAHRAPAAGLALVSGERQVAVPGLCDPAERLSQVVDGEVGEVRHRAPARPTPGCAW